MSTRVQGNRSLIVRPGDLEAAKAIAAERGVELVVTDASRTVRRWDVASAREVAVTEVLHRITVTMPEDTDVPYVLGLWNDGILTTFDDSFAWSEESADVDPYRCDRCRTRRARKRVFVVRYKGGVMQVGGTCVKEMDLELSVKRQLAEFRAVLDRIAGTLDPDDMMGFSEPTPKWFHVVELKAFLAACAHLAKRGEYVTKKAATYGAEPTADLLLGDMLSKDETTRRDFWKLAAEEGDDWLARVQAWADAASWSDYVHNVRTALKRPAYKYAGLLGSAAMCVVRDEQKARNHATVDALKPYPEPDGKKRAALKGRFHVVRGRWISGVYGDSFLAVLANEEGLAVMGFFSGGVGDDLCDALERGADFALKATFSGRTDDRSGLPRVKRPNVTM